MGTTPMGRPNWSNKQNTINGQNTPVNGCGVIKSCVGENVVENGTVFQSVPTYGHGLIGAAVPSNPNACIKNQACIYENGIVLHPIDIVNPQIIGINFVYSNNDEIIGYSYLTAILDYRTTIFHWEMLNWKFWVQKLVDEASTNTMEQNLKYLGKESAAGIFRKITIALTVYDILKISNEFITFDSQGFRNGPINYLQNNLIQPNMRDNFYPFTSFP
ncbi:hypothetical protein MASR2M66_26000 [Chloroflexota bacterium]